MREISTMVLVYHKALEEIFRHKIVGEKIRFEAPTI